MSIEETIIKLSGYPNDEYPITSLYLKLGPRERENFIYTIKLKNMIKNLREDQESRSLSKEAAESVEKDIAKITGFIDDPDNLTECRGIAVFSCSEKGLWEVLKLPYVYRNQLVADRSAVIGQLIKVEDEYTHIVTVLVDRKKARIFKLDSSGVSEILDYFYPAASRTTKFHSPESQFKKMSPSASGYANVAQGFGEYGFNRTIENEIHQHYKYIAEKVLDYYREMKFHWLILGGTDENISEFSHHLHSSLEDKLAGAISTDMDRVKPSQVAEETLDAVEAAIADRQEKLIQEFSEKLSNGYALDGIKSSWNALLNGQVRVLLVAEGFSQPGFICPESGQISIDGKDGCPENKEALPVQDLVDRAIEGAFGQGGEVEIVSGDELKKQIQGVGAILRFTV
ncbi:MAG: hypothetical protein RIG61_07730 [Deltaproteobacteria bacterium]